MCSRNVSQEAMTALYRSDTGHRDSRKNNGSLPNYKLLRCDAHLIGGKIINLFSFNPTKTSGEDREISR